MADHDIHVHNLTADFEQHNNHMQLKIQQLDRQREESQQKEDMFRKRLNIEVDTFREQIVGVCNQRDVYRQQVEMLQMQKHENIEVIGRFKSLISNIWLLEYLRHENHKLQTSLDDINKLNDLKSKHSKFVESEKNRANAELTRIRRILNKKEGQLKHSESVISNLK